MTTHVPGVPKQPRPDLSACMNSVDQFHVLYCSTTPRLVPSTPPDPSCMFLRGDQRSLSLGSLRRCSRLLACCHLSNANLGNRVLHRLPPTLILLNYTKRGELVAQAATPLSSTASRWRIAHRQVHRHVHCKPLLTCSTTRDKKKRGSNLLEASPARPAQSARPALSSAL